MKKAQQPKISPVVNTANILSTYLGSEMKTWNVIPAYASYVLEAVFGKEIHLQIDGLIQFAKDEKYGGLSEHDIKVTLAHDLGGAMRSDKMMLPRVTGYDKYTNLKK